jgi:hypothetical protein
MKRILFGLLILFGLNSCTSTPSEQYEAALLPTHPIPGMLRSLPPRAIIGGNLIREENWYVLRASEINALNKVISGEPYLNPPGTESRIEPWAYDIILWGVDGTQVVPFDYIYISEKAKTLLSSRAQHVYLIGAPEDEPQHSILESMIKRTEKEEERVRSGYDAAGKNNSSSVPKEQKEK